MRATQVLYDGFVFSLFEGDGISETVRRGEPWEPHLLELLNRFVGPGDVVCDAGANFGFHTLHMARRVGTTGAVLAFEPQRVIFQQLCHHIFANSAANVHALPFALGHTYGRAAIAELHEVAASNIGATTLGRGSHIVDVFPLDHFARYPMTFIKLDVQGLESKILSGAEEVIAQNRPLLFVEIEENWLRGHGSSSKELIESLFARDYTLLRIMTSWPTDHLAFPRSRRDEVLGRLEGYPWKTTLLEGTSVELSFLDKPYYETAVVSG